MSSLSALKYNISIRSSYYAGMVIFLLYSLVILLALFVAPLTNISLIFYCLLLLVALYAARKAYLQHDELLLSESGQLERRIGELRYHGQINAGSFYNGFFIFLKLDIKSAVFNEKKSTQFITIYKDAVSEEQYRLLARLIHNGRS